MLNNLKQWSLPWGTPFEEYPRQNRLGVPAQEESGVEKKSPTGLEQSRVNPDLMMNPNREEERILNDEIHKLPPWDQSLESCPLFINGIGETLNLPECQLPRESEDWINSTPHASLFLIWRSFDLPNMTATLPTSLLAPHPWYLYLQKHWKTGAPFSQDKRKAGPFADAACADGTSRPGLCLAATLDK